MQAVALKAASVQSLWTIPELQFLAARHLRGLGKAQSERKGGFDALLYVCVCIARVVYHNLVPSAKRALEWLLV